MKNNVVTTASGPVYDDDESGETAAERLGGAIDIGIVSAGNHSIGSAIRGFLMPEIRLMIDKSMIDDLWTAGAARPLAGQTCNFTSQFAGSGRMAKVGSLPRTMATSSQQ
jgi:hypothetical protein